MAKDGQVCFLTGLFADPVNTQTCTTEPVGPLDGIIKDVSGAKLHPTAVQACPVDCDCFCHLLNTHYCCMSLSGSFNPPSASHPPPPPPHPPPARPPPINFIRDITAVDKNHLKNQQSQLDGKFYL